MASSLTWQRTKGDQASQDLAGLVTLGAGVAPAGRNKLRVGASVRQSPTLDMSDAARAARAKSMGYDDAPFYRGDRGLYNRSDDPAPSEYPGGAHFTRDPDYNSGSFGQNREFRLNLNNAFLDDRPVTADQFGRLVEAAQKHDPKLAAHLASLVDRDPDWIIGSGKARPDQIVDDGGAHIRYLIERSAAPEQVFISAGFDAIGSGYEVRKLTGDGVRLATARFDPAKAHSGNITAGLAVGGTAAATQAAMEWGRQNGVEIY